MKRTFDVLPMADKVYGCHRCGAKLRTGERATITHANSNVRVRHAGRTCPPVSPMIVPPVPTRRSPRASA